MDNEAPPAESTPTVEMQEFFPQSIWAYVCTVLMFLLMIPGIMAALSSGPDPTPKLAGTAFALLFASVGIAQIIYLKRAKIFVGNGQFIMFSFSKTAKIDVGLDEITSIRYEIPKHTQSSGPGGYYIYFKNRTFGINLSAYPDADDIVRAITMSRPGLIVDDERSTTGRADEMPL